jgi:hypothetical protein
MTTRQLKETDYLVAWAIFWLSALIGGFVVGAIGGGLLGAILGAVGTPIQTIKLVCGAFGFLLSIPLSYALFRFTVAKFIVPKLSTQNDPVPPSPPMA